MLIAQITDIHIGFEPGAETEELNRQRLRATLARIKAAPNVPDLMVVSGDLTDRGDLASFAMVAELLADCGIPVWPMVGNHDTREGLLHAFPRLQSTDGFVHYTLEAMGLRAILLDTLEPGRHGGAFCLKRQDWLEAELDAAPDTPTLIFMHHPPVVSGIGWMDPGADEEWIARFSDALAGRRQILAIHCGHLHRPLATSLCGIPVHVTPSIAPLVAMDLRPIDPHAPDGRDLITTEPPAYALHHWDGQRLTTHYESVGDWQVLARYTQQLQPMISGMFDERS